MRIRIASICVFGGMITNAESSECTTNGRARGVKIFNANLSGMFIVDCFKILKN